MSFVFLSDLHFVDGDDLLFDMSPRARFRPVIDRINTDHGDADFVLIGGDLANAGARGAYETLKSELLKIEKPIRLMLGNHDSRDTFFDVFPEADRDTDGFAQFVIDSEHYRLICCDTLDEGKRPGYMCGRRLSWLDEQLSVPAGNRKLIVALHHPPFDLGIHSMDLIKLRNPEELWQVISRHRLPDQFLLGHVHRPINGNWRGIPFHIQRGFNHQVALSFEHSTRILGCDDDPDYSIVRANTDTIAVYTRPVGGERRLFPFIQGRPVE